MKKLDEIILCKCWFCRTNCYRPKRSIYHKTICSTCYDLRQAQCLDQ